MKLLMIFLIFSSYLCLKADNLEELRNARNLKEFVNALPKASADIKHAEKASVLKISSYINTIPELQKLIELIIELKGENEIKNQKDLIHRFAESQKADLILYLVDRKLADINHLDKMKESVVDKALRYTRPTYANFNQIPEAIHKIINHKDYNIYLESHGQNVFQKILSIKLEADIDPRESEKNKQKLRKHFSQFYVGENYKEANEKIDDRMEKVIQQIDSKRQLIKMCLDRGFDPYHLDTNRSNLLFHINDRVTLEYFIKRYGLDLNQKNKGGNTLLMHHIKEKSTNLSLLNYIADHPQLDKNLVDSNYKSYLDLIKENYTSKRVNPIRAFISSDYSDQVVKKEFTKIKESLSKRFTKKHQSKVRFNPTKEQKTYLRNKARALFKSLQKSIRPSIPSKGR